MRAVQIDRFGDPEVLEVTEVERPAPGPGEVLVAVGASSVNGHDSLVRSGALRIMTGRRFPLGVGLDFAGTAVSTGPGVDPDIVGREVWGTVHPREKHRVAGAAEYVVVPADRIGPVPPGLTPVDAASMVVAGVTALTALHEAARLTGGERVLVRGAAGGVGTAAVQLAHALGSDVTALARDRHARALTELGADRVLDYRSTTPEETGPFDVILDTVGTDLAVWRRRLAPGGRMVTVGLSPSALAAVARSAVHGGRRIRTFSANPHTAQLNELAAQVGAGALHPVVDGVYPLDDIASAHRAFDRGGVLGKQVVSVTA